MSAGSGFRNAHCPSPRLSHELIGVGLLAWSPRQRSCHEFQSASRVLRQNQRDMKGPPSRSRIRIAHGLRRPWFGASVCSWSLQSGPNARAPNAWAPNGRAESPAATLGSHSGQPLWAATLGCHSGLPLLSFKLLCFDRGTGDMLWQRIATTSTPHDPTHATHGFASASRCTDAQWVYAHFGSGGLYCYTIDGKLVWQRDESISTKENRVCCHVSMQRREATST
ncbi:hypothetical protein Pla52o_00780 [Novipirellula galeiformis]|uniref:PQQ enzyme repeat protein n=1 Tax=Novipirellula galeiformis TaxID=2528004 RepID=A0A5C6CQL7_9BACT|nr:hypothetical protein Pla52o_00780 [Novipirellula galeiformis]